jgi:uncharacterized protein CbrC (UPF0167 family)
MPPSDSIESGSTEIPEALRQQAEVLPLFEGEALESQLQTFDIFLGVLSPEVRPEVAQMLSAAAARTENAESRARIVAAAHAVAQGERAAEPYDHEASMRAYRKAFKEANPQADVQEPPVHSRDDYSLGDSAPEAAAVEEADTPLPFFKYHPDPLASGSIEESDTECVCCGRARGYIYTGPVYAEEEYEASICPWCIADGQAAERLDASFTDEAEIGGYGEWDEVAESVIEEVARRTPGFSGWQQERWWTHCGDAAQFLGAAGKAELLAYGEQAVQAIRDSAEIEDEAEWQAFFAALDQHGSPCAYVFRCSKCGVLGGYQDCD